MLKALCASLCPGLLQLPAPELLIPRDSALPGQQPEGKQCRGDLLLCSSSSRLIYEPFIHDRKTHMFRNHWSESLRVEEVGADPAHRDRNKAKDPAGSGRGWAGVPAGLSCQFSWPGTVLCCSQRLEPSWLSFQHFQFCFSLVLPETKINTVPLYIHIYI